MRLRSKPHRHDRIFWGLSLAVAFNCGFWIQNPMQSSEAKAAESVSRQRAVGVQDSSTKNGSEVRATQHVYELAASDGVSDFQSSFSGEALAKRLTGTAERITTAWNTLQAKSRRQMKDDYVIDIRVSKEVAENACRFEISIDTAGLPHLQVLFGKKAILQPEFVAQIFAVLYAPYAHQTSPDLDRLYPYEWLGLFHDAKLGDRSAQLELKKLWIEGLKKFPMDWLDIYFSGSSSKANPNTGPAQQPSAVQSSVQSSLQNKTTSLEAEVAKDTQTLAAWRDAELRLHQEKLKKSKWNVKPEKLREYLGDLFAQNRREEFAQFLLAHLPWRLMTPTQRQIWESQIRAIKTGPTANDVIVYRSASTTKFYIKGQGMGFGNQNYGSLARIFEEGLKQDLNLESIFTPVFTQTDRNQATNFWLTNIYEAERAHSAGGTRQSPFISTATVVEPSLEFLNTPGTPRTGEENITAWRISPYGAMPSLLTTWQEEELLRPFGLFADEFVAKVDVPGDIVSTKIAAQIKKLVVQYQTANRMVMSEQSVTTDSELARDFIFRLWTNRNSSWQDWDKEQNELKRSSFEKIKATLSSLPADLTKIDFTKTTSAQNGDSQKNTSDSPKVDLLELKEQIIKSLLDTNVDKNFESEWTGFLFQLSQKNQTVQNLVREAFNEIQKVGGDPRQNRSENRFFILRLLIDPQAALGTIQFESLAGVYTLVDQSNRVFLSDHSNPLALDAVTKNAFIATYRQLIETRLGKSQDENEKSLYQQAKMFLPKDSSAANNPQCQNIVSP